MHRIALALSLVISGAGCAYRPIPIEDDFQPATPGPLSVRMLPPDNGMLRFLTSEPAYVAVFEIVPDHGVSMLYPAFNDTRVSAVGLNTAFIPSHVIGRSYYASTQYYNAAASLSKPTYLYVIASKSPLPVREIQRSPVSVRATLGWRSFLAHDLSGTLDDIERLVAGSLPEDDWSSDLYVVWPDVRSDLPWQMQYAFVPCADGRIVLVPLGWNIAACPGTTNLAQATKPSSPGTKPPTPPGTIPDSTDSPDVPIRVGGGMKGGPVRPVDRLPVDLSVMRPGNGDRGEARPPVREPVRPPEGRPTPGPVPASTPPRAEPPRSEPPRSEPPRAEPSRPTPAPNPSPSEPAERKPAEKP